MIRAYHRARGDTDRDEVLVPDSSHGTNPATASMAGFRTITIPSAADGGVDVDAFRAALGPRTAAVMITNPSTLGLFEARIGELLDAVHDGGRPGLHGRREPQRDPGPVQARRGRLRRHALQRPQDVQHAARRRRPGRRPGRGGGDACCRTCPSRASCATDDGTFRLERTGERPTSIGRLRSFVGNTGVLVRAYAYIRAHGGDAACARSATTRSSPPTTSSTAWPARYDIPYDRPCKHEFVASAATIKKRTGVRTLDIAKRLIDHGFHPPTIYFPLIVDEGMLIEPTETESVETLDAFADALIAIAAEARDRSRGWSRRPRTRPRCGASTRRPRPASRTCAGAPMTGAQTPCPD